MGIKLMNATVYVYDEKKPNYVLASIRINDFVKWKYNSTTKQLSLLTEILILQRKLLILY